MSNKRKLYIDLAAARLDDNDLPGAVRMLVKLVAVIQAEEAKALRELEQYRASGRSAPRVPGVRFDAQGGLLFADDIDPDLFTQLTTGEA